MKDVSVTTVHHIFKPCTFRAHKWSKNFAQQRTKEISRIKRKSCKAQMWWDSELNFPSDVSSQNFYWYTFFLPISLRTSTFLDINERLASTFLLLLPSFCCLDNRTYKSDILSHTFPKSTSIFQGWSPLILVENMKSSHKINCKSEWSKKGQQTIY